MQARFHSLIHFKVSLIAAPIPLLFRNYLSFFVKTHRMKKTALSRLFSSISRTSFLIVLGLLFFISCKKKDPKVELVENNNAPYYDKIDSITIQNYVNRLFIDLVGREAFDSELKAETDKLKADNLAFSTREALILKLQTDPTHRLGDSSYQIAYHKQIYNLLTVRLCEGFGENDFLYYKGLNDFGVLIDSTLHNMAGYYQGKLISKQLYDAAEARWLYMKDSIDISDYCTILINNYLTFTKTDSYMGNEDNTIKYTFNDLLMRPYTAYEFSVARPMILDGASGVLLGKSGHSKGDYFYIITHDKEFFECTIRWLYKTFLAREPSVEEIMGHMNTFMIDKDIKKIQRAILKTDEYANFKFN